MRKHNGRSNGKSNGKTNGIEPRLIIRKGIPFPGRKRRQGSIIAQALAKLQTGDSFHIHKSLNLSTVRVTISKIHARDKKKRYGIGREKKGGFGVWRNV